MKIKNLLNSILLCALSSTCLHGTKRPKIEQKKPIDMLCDDVLIEIFSLLSTTEIFKNVRQVSKEFNHLCLRAYSLKRKTEVIRPETSNGFLDKKKLVSAYKLIVSLKENKNKGLYGNISFVFARDDLETFGFSEKEIEELKNSRFVSLIENGALNIEDGKNILNHEVLKLNLIESLQDIKNPEKLKKLKEVDISGLRSVGFLDSLKKLPNLKSLNVNLGRCTNYMLEFENLDKLTKLEITGCNSMIFLNLKALKQLEFLKLHNFNNLPGLNLDELTQLKHVDLSDLGELDSVSFPKSINTLKMSGCKKMKQLNIPRYIHHLALIDAAITSLELPKQTTLESLTLENCQILSYVIWSENLNSLKALTINHCLSLNNFPDFNKLTNLTCLKLLNFYQNSMHNNCKLKKFYALSLDKLNKLEVLCITGFDNLTTLNLPYSIKILNLEGFDKIKYLKLYNLSRLVKIRMKGFNSLVTLHAHNLTSLEHARFDGFKDISTFNMNFPNLKFLEIIGFHDDFSKIENLNFKYLRNLKILIMSDSYIPVLRNIEDLKGKLDCFWPPIGLASDYFKHTFPNAFNRKKEGSQHYRNNFQEPNKYPKKHVMHDVRNQSPEDYDNDEFYDQVLMF